MLHLHVTTNILKTMLRPVVAGISWLILGGICEGALVNPRKKYLLLSSKLNGYCMFNIKFGSW